MTDQDCQKSYSVQVKTNAVKSSNFLLDRIQVLMRALDLVRDLDQPVGQNGFAVVDMGHDREVARGKTGSGCLIGHSHAELLMQLLATSNSAPS